LYLSTMRYISLLALFPIVVIGSLSFPNAGRAQGLLIKEYPPSTWIGFRAGGSIISENLAELTGGASQGLKFGFDGGLDIDHWFNGDWGISTGVSFMQKGVDQSYASVPGQGLGSGDDYYSMNFVEIPVLLKKGFGVSDISAGGARPFINIGPCFGFLASSSETTNGNIPPLNNPTSNLEKFSVSLYFGAGTMFFFNEGPAIFFDAGYETGLTNVFKVQPPPRAFYTPTGQVAKTANDIMVTVGAIWQLWGAPLGEAKN
jgi:hypothetical protein